LTIRINKVLWYQVYKNYSQIKEEKWMNKLILCILLTVLSQTALAVEVSLTHNFVTSFGAKIGDGAGIEAFHKDNITGKLDYSLWGAHYTGNDYTEFDAQLHYPIDIGNVKLAWVGSYFAVKDANDLLKNRLVIKYKDSPVYVYYQNFYEIDGDMRGYSYAVAYSTSLSEQVSLILSLEKANHIYINDDWNPLAKISYKINNDLSFSAQFTNNGTTDQKNWDIGFAYQF